MKNGNAARSGQGRNAEGRRKARQTITQSKSSPPKLKPNKNPGYPDTPSSAYSARLPGTTKLHRAPPRLRRQPATDPPSKPDQLSRQQPEPGRPGRDAGAGGAPAVRAVGRGGAVAARRAGGPPPLRPAPLRRLRRQRVPRPGPRLLRRVALLLPPNPIRVGRGGPRHGGRAPPLLLPAPPRPPARLGLRMALPPAAPRGRPRLRRRGGF